ncbi:uncharacterized protein LOC123511090 [Portunus trituberculatus]|uniref:uncharacterized protein LOC123511090 n=1 Tax=Portunus trituberculatus TaxID=210409 RepID=UPI001E1CEA3C|nr:uncharacterized protein LOC123511090 [Portunus trituberculatus]
MISAVVVIPEVEDMEDYAPLTTKAIQRETVDDVQVSSKLDLEERMQVNPVRRRHADVFSLKPRVTKVDYHEIKLISTTSLRMKPYPIPIRLVNTVKEIDNIEAPGIIRKSSSPYCSPIVIICNKDEGVRLCGNYWRVYAVTCVDAEPMNDQQDIFARIAN